jgi:5'-deoxynucleotidase YfbR-like HD superfamily hydrolase
MTGINKMAEQIFGWPGFGTFVAPAEGTVPKLVAPERRWPAAAEGVVPEPGEVASYDGHLVDVTAPKAEHYALAELGGLAHVNRWGGRTRRPYSVAAHSLHVAEIARHLYWSGPRWLRLACLLHDAPELYLSDVVAPLKHLPAFDAYRQLEATHSAVVEAAYRLPPGALDAPERKVCDQFAQAVEAHHLVKQRRRWSRDLEQLAAANVHLPRYCLEPWPRTSAEALGGLFTREVALAAGAWWQSGEAPDADPPATVRSGAAR